MESERAQAREHIAGDLVTLGRKFPRTKGGMAALYSACFYPAVKTQAFALFSEHSENTAARLLADAVELGESGDHSRESRSTCNTLASESEAEP